MEMEVTNYYNCTIVNGAIAYADGDVLRLFNCNVISAGVTGRAVVVNTDSAGYKVNICGLSNASAVVFPTWTSKNGQDDIIWCSETKMTQPYGQTGQVRINKSSHNNETGIYHTHIYATINGVQSNVRTVDLTLN